MQVFDRTNSDTWQLPLTQVNLSEKFEILDINSDERLLQSLFHGFRLQKQRLLGCCAQGP